MKRLRSERKDRKEAKLVRWAKEDASRWVEAIGIDTIWCFRTPPVLHTDVGLLRGSRMMRATLQFIDEHGFGHWEAEGPIGVIPGREETIGMEPLVDSVKGTFVAPFSDVFSLGVLKDGVKSPGEEGITVPEGFVTPEENRKLTQRDVMRLVATAKR